MFPAPLPLPESKSRTEPVIGDHRRIDPLVATACSTFALQTESSGQFPAAVAWIVAGAMLVLAAACWLPLRAAAAKLAAASVEIAALRATLAQALERIQGFSVAQGRLVDNLAQELKVPLATVLIQADLLLASSGEPSIVQRYAKSVAEDMRHLSDLVESYLRLARPLVPEDTRHHVPVHVHDLVLEAVRRCQALAGTRDVRVVPMLAEAGNYAAVEVLGDAILLEAMIENLVRNAVLCAPRRTSVHLHVKVEGEAVLLAVRDQGPKIDRDHLDAVFDGFFQVAIAPRPSLNTGLSLAIAKRVAEHHRGTISLRNVPEGGCEFLIHLPRWRPEGQLAASTT